MEVPPIEEPCGFAMIQAVRNAQNRFSCSVKAMAATAKAKAMCGMIMLYGYMVRLPNDGGPVFPSWRKITSITFSRFLNPTSDVLPPIETESLPYDFTLPSIPS